MQGFKLGSSVAALFVGSCVLSGKDGSHDRPGKIPDRVETAAALLRERGFLTREEFVSICGFDGKPGEVSVGQPYEGRMGINESWTIENGITVKTSGYSAWGRDLSSEMIDQVISGKILDHCKIVRIWIFDGSGELISSATGKGAKL